MNETILLNQLASQSVSALESLLNGAGIRESKDGGLTWQPTIALPAAMKGAGNLSWLECDARHDSLFVMTMGSDLYQWRRGQ